MGEFRISPHEKKALELALRDGRVRATAGNKIPAIVLVNMTTPGKHWLKSRRENYRVIYELTDTGRAVARQLGLGGAV